MADRFREFFWIIFPIFGMGVGAFAIWNEFSRQKKALEVLKVYAEKGTEPPQSVLDVLTRASVSRPRRGGGMASAVFFGMLAAGFGGMALWSYLSDGSQSVAGMWAVAAVVLAALCGSHVVRALSAPRQNDH